jgi:hypothetical protein
MPFDHISNEAMKSYLLGQLPDEQTAALEEEYFCNREFFLKIQSAETTLITDYLEGTLPPAEKFAFENRYLQTPLLQRKLEEVRRQRSEQKTVTQPYHWNSWRLALATAAVLVLGLGLWRYRPDGKNQYEPAASQQQPQLHSVIAIHISPNLVKGNGARSVQFERPKSGATINLVLELPGQSTPTRCMVRVSMVDADGSWVPIWNSLEPITSSKDGGGQVLILQLGGTLLRAGDYKLEAWTQDGTVRETYPYQVTEQT